MSARLKLVAVGPGATIQDGGRTGWLRYGVTGAGPMDWVAFETANRAIGNEPGAAALELSAGGVTLVAETSVTVAFAGGAFLWFRDAMALPAAARVVLRPGETLRARAGPWGAFSYLAVPGGLDVPPVLGARATHVRSRLGGFEGRMLMAGDVLAAASDGIERDDAAIRADWLRPDDAPLRVILGPQDDHFEPSASQALAEARFTLTNQADRMAYKLSGPRLSHLGDYNIVSDGVLPGAIQVAGDGQPMVLMADAQPTGGYPKIAYVCRADLGRLAQLRPGASCRFAIVDRAEARTALMGLEARIAETPRGLETLRLAPTAARLFAANLISGVTDGRADT